MKAIKLYIIKNFERIFVVATVVVTILINYYIPYKIAFLNLYFLSIIWAGYYLGKRQAVLGAVLCISVVTIYVINEPGTFVVKTDVDTYLTIITWGGFLILAGAFVAKLQERLTEEVAVHRKLNQDLHDRQEQLNEAHASLTEYSANLEDLNRDLQARQEELNQANLTLQQRTGELEESRRAIEALKTKVEETLYSTMDSTVVNLMIEGRLRDEKRSVTILISDLRGFTAYSEENPPEVVIRDLNRYFADMEPILLAYRGHIDKYMGDGIMCEFGAPLDFETHRLMAVMAALKMQERMAKMNYPWQMRIGICSGATITGLVGGSKRQSYTAIGDVVNLSSRLEGACRPGYVLIDRFTFLDVSRFFLARKRVDLPTKDITNIEKEHQLQGLHEKLAADPKDADAYYKIGQLHMSLNEVIEAFEYFEQALGLDPNNKDSKMAYAEAGMKIKEFEKFSVKGRRKRVEAYEVIGLKDPWENRDKIPQHIYEEYKSVADLIQIPADVTLPVECLDGSIGHSKVVAILSFALAGCFEVSDKERVDILHAGFMADIGKEIVPHHLLNRVGSIRSSEFDMVRMHPDEGSRVLRKMGYENEFIIDVVRHSHENYNGSGYPEGLKGDAIPLGSRIIAVADAYDALTSWRPYRESWERHAALDEIRRGVAKGLYDPRVVEQLVRFVS
jgi:HD-GYP domain-containing protein (c-di-GMP phosphodiesterase class II)